MQTQAFIEEKLSTPIAYDVDVLVCGGGTAGFVAALASARTGAKTLLIERGGVIGGTMISGAGPLHSFFNLFKAFPGVKKQQLIHGIPQEIVDRMVAIHASYGHLEQDKGGNYDSVITLLDWEQFKDLALVMLEEAGVKLLLHTLAAAPILEGERLAGVIIESKSGRQAVMARVVIDASGDGDIAAKSGAEYDKGRDADGKMQPMTMMFQLAGVDKSRAVFLGSFESTYETPRGELQALAREHLTHPAGHVLLYNSPPEDVVTCNMTNVIDSDGTRAEDLTAATVTCRRQMTEIIAFLREFVPGYENCYLHQAASLMGVRETRRFRGVYTLTEYDILNARVLDDWVVRGAYFNFDVHNITGAGLDETGAQAKFLQKEGYTIPYGALVPERIDNLLLAGRIISGTHIAHSNYRVMPICAAIGEAAGVAAAIAVQKGIPVRKVDVHEIQTVIAGTR